jgi:hypothetical protein
MMTPRDHMSHDLSYFSGPRTSGAARAEGIGGLSAPRVLGPRQEPETGQGEEQVPRLGGGAEQTSVWHLLGRQHMCEVGERETAPRGKKK